jgi:hypothetical protein
MIARVGLNADTKIHELMLMAKNQRPDWEGDRLLALPKDQYVDLKSFLVKRYRTQQGVVAFKDVDRFISSVGDIEVDWRSLLRICHNQKLAEHYLWSADYWTDPARKEGVSFVALDDHLVISRGLYKTAVARYVLHYYGTDSLYGVKLSRWSVDWDMYQIWLELKKICAEQGSRYIVAPRKKKIDGYREGNSVIDEYLLTLKRKDKHTGKITRLGKNGAKEWLDELKRERGDSRVRMDELKVGVLAA